MRSPPDQSVGHEEGRMIAVEARRIDCVMTAQRRCRGLPEGSRKKIIGWGVVRMAPWHLVGIYQTSDEAQVRCLDMGRGYEVHFGEGDNVSDSFIWSETSH